MQIAAPLDRNVQSRKIIYAAPLLLNCEMCGCNQLKPRSSAATSAAATAAWRSSPPSAAPRRASADLVAERRDAAICPKSGEKRKCAACARNDVDDPLADVTASSSRSGHFLLLSVSKFLHSSRLAKERMLVRWIVAVSNELRCRSQETIITSHNGTKRDFSKQAAQRLPMST